MLEAGATAPAFLFLGGTAAVRKNILSAISISYLLILFFGFFR